MAQFQLFLSILGFSIFLSCRSSQPINKAPTQSEMKVISGIDPDQYKELASSTVVIIEKVGESTYKPFCSGVLATVAGETIVLTAAHCLESVQFRYMGSYFIYFDENAEFKKPGFLSSGHKFDANLARQFSDARMHPFYFESAGKPMYDIGWVKFSGTAPKNYKSIPIYSNDIKNIAAASLEHVFAGYGHREAEDNETKQKMGLLQFGTGNGIRFVDQSILHNILAVKLEEQYNCFGDSGGPLFVKNNGQWQVLGVTHGAHKAVSPELRGKRSVGPSTCSTSFFKEAIYTPITPYLHWIELSSKDPNTPYEEIFSFEELPQEFLLNTK